MTHSTLFSRLSAMAAGPALAIALGGLCACQGDGTTPSQIFRGADETIHGAGPMEVQDTVVDVMTENGFSLASPVGNIMTFEKEGTRNDEWMYGAYGSRPMRQRVTVTLTTGDDPETIKLVASGKVVREYSNMSGEETGLLFAGGAMRYSRYLDEVKARLKKPIHTPPAR